MISDDEVIKVSIRDIKERLLKSVPVHFVGEQEDRKRTIKAEWITNALKKKYGVEEIDIKNAIITGDLDFHIKDNLVDINKSGIGADEVKRLKSRGIGIEKVFFASASITIESCQIQDNLKAAHNDNPSSIVIFMKPIFFSELYNTRRSEFFGR